MAENRTETVSMMINELHVNQNEDLEGLINYTESARIESEWTVEDGFMTAPVSFCSATVCNGALKTWDEIKKTWQMWEGRPITFEHPDQMVVKNPTDIIGFLGNVEKDEENKRLKGELYVMKEPAEFNHQDDNYWKVMLQALKDREEISIGYWAVPENEEGTHTDEFGNELEYDETVTQILPDHIASVDKGACSPEQGCGIGVESKMDPQDYVRGSNGRSPEEEEDDKMSLLNKIHEKLKTLVKKDHSKDPQDYVRSDNEDETDEILHVRGSTGCNSKEDTEEVEDMDVKRNEDGGYKIVEEKDSMIEEEKSEENETDEEAENCEHDEVIEEKEEMIEELREQMEALKNELDEYKQQEISRLREKAEELTELTKEQLEDKERHELEALIEGASNARSTEPTEKKEAGKNLRSPPRSNDVEGGPEVIDLYEDPLNPQ